MNCSSSPANAFFRIQFLTRSRARCSRPAGTFFQRCVTTGNATTSVLNHQLEALKLRHFRPDEGHWDCSNITALRNSLRNHLDLPVLPEATLVPPGYHHVSFNRLLEEAELSHDGAERYHAPSDEWKYRVWAGGHMEFHRPFIHVNHPALVAVREKITATRVAGDPASDEAKVFVTLRKRLFSAMLDDQGEPVVRNDQLRVADSEHALMVSEDRYLCFMRQIPLSLKSPSSVRRLAPSSTPTYSQSMRPTPALLFRFSALTRNAHAIHLDQEFARQVYGLPKLLVHGPLTAVLMLDILGEALTIQTAKEDYVFSIQTFSYKNLMPLFVGEKITIACNKVHNVRPEDGKFVSRLDVPWQKWDVWIEKGEGQDATIAVRGSALVIPVKRNP